MMEHAPLVSVVMPAYNAARYIEEAIHSVLDQTVSDLELIIVDDCSSDDTGRIAERMAADDGRIRLIRNSVNSGVSTTRNNGLNHVQGRYVALLDSDDIWYPEKLEKQLRLLETEKADLCYASYRLVKAVGKEPISTYSVPEQVSFTDLLAQNWIGCSTVVMTRELADRHRFSSDFYHEDYVLWLQMLQRGAKMVGVREVLVDYRFYPTSKAGNKLTSAKHRWDIYRRCLGIPWIKSIGYLAGYALAGIKKYKTIM